ncbi:MAG: hypothetical protein KDA61_16830, partial [Planctomycetales bacterium]|nr:hypothetical protein [Planctomycetales bacterium]
MTSLVITPQRSNVAQGKCADWPTLWIAAACLLVGCLSSARSVRADVVRYRDVDGGEAVLVGSISDLTGRIVVVETEKGPTRRIDADRVTGVETTWDDERTVAQVQMASGEFANARALLERAVQKERRAWARRQLMVDMAWCERELGNGRACGELLLLVLQSDPDAAVWEVAPMTWAGKSLVSNDVATQWLASSQPAAQLWGASALCQEEGRADAWERLESLARDANAIFSVRWL